MASPTISLKELCDLIKSIDELKRDISDLYTRIDALEVYVEKEIRNIKKMLDDLSDGGVKK